MSRHAQRRGGQLDPSSRRHVNAAPGRKPQRNILLGIERTPGFTLADEARSTAHDRSAWSQDSRLRSRPMTFVSAGAVDPLKQLEEQLQQRAQEAIDQISATVSKNHGDKQQDVHLERRHGHPLVEQAKRDMAEVIAETPGDTSSARAELIAEGLKTQSRVGSPKENCCSDQPEMCPESTLFYFDTARQPSQCLVETMPTEMPGREAEMESDTGEEDVILFKGRKNMRKKPSGQAQMQMDNSRAIFDFCEIRKEIQEVDQIETHGTQPLKVQPSPQGSHPASRSLTRAQKKQERNEKKRNKKNRKAGRGGRPSIGGPNLSETEQLDDVSVGDYIANMQEYDNGLEASRCLKLRDLGVTDNAADVFDTIHHDGSACEPSSLSGASTLSNGQPKDCMPVQAEDGGVHSTVLEAVHVPPENHLARAESDSEEGADGEGLDVDYDLMAWSGPTTARSRGKKGSPLYLNVSDSELEAQMLATFESNRLRKAAKRKQRDVLRAQGLLGSQTKVEDLRIKYPRGMKLDEIAVELKEFLLGQQSSLTLPPMDNQSRKVIHELANKFNIKSKSTGAGDQRRPTLYRTVRTFKYAEEAFDTAIARVGRKYYPRRDRVPRSTTAQQSRGQGSQAMTYRDGEIVGGSAPELGEGNKGRLILEKMGWSTGTALGTTTNKGILTPVEQKIKRGKAGLG